MLFRSFETNHPISLDPDLVRKMLAGVHVQERKTMVESTLTEDPKFVPVFMLSEVDFLAPLLTDALGRATAGEQVSFRISSSVSGKRLETAGTVYATETNINFSLTQYGLLPQQPGTLSRPSRSFDRAKRWSLTFTPEMALVNQTVETEVSADGSRPNTLVISLELLQRYPYPETRADRKSTRLNSSHSQQSRMPSSA